MLGPAHHRRPRHPPHRRRHRACSAAAGTGVCFCPTTERDLADGIGPARALADAGLAAHASAATATPSSTCSRRRARSSWTSGCAPEQRGHWTAAELLDAATVDGHAALGWPDAGPDRGRARAPTWSPSRSTPSAPPAVPRPARSRGLRGDRRRRRRTWWSDGRVVVARRPAPAASDVPADARRRAIERGDARMTQHCWSTNIGELVTNDPALGDGPARHPTRRGRRRRGRRGSPGSGRPATRPAADERVDAGGRGGAPRLRRLPLPPGLRRRPGRRVRRPDGRAAATPPAASAPPSPPPGPPPTSELRGHVARLVGGGAAPGHHDRRDQERLRPDRRRRGPRLRIAAEFTDETTFLGAHVVPAEYADDPADYVALVTGADARRLRAARPLDRRVLRAGRLRRRPGPRRS